jgi:hypothetical protein
VGEILDLAFRIYRHTLLKCLVLSALAVIISQLPNAYFLLSGRGLKLPFFVLLRDPAYLRLFVVGVLMALVLDAAVLLRQYRMSTGGPPEGALSVAVRRAPALVALVVLFWLMLLACVAPALLFQAPARWGVFALLVLVAVYVLVSFSSGLTVLLVSGAGPVASLARSWRLTRGSFWRLVLIYSVASAIFGVLYILVGAATGFVVAVAAHGDLAMVTAASTVVGVALGALARPFITAVQLTVFGDLTARREGTDLAQRISASA